jgi:hypothetical protein
MRPLVQIGDISVYQQGTVVDVYARVDYARSLTAGAQQ